MRILVIGAGFTGLTAAYELLKAGHQVTLVEKEAKPGGLAVGFEVPGWDWTLERHYHHWFSNDTFAIDLIREVDLGDQLFFKSPRTDVFIAGKIYPFTKPEDILHFTPLSPLSRLRLALITTYLKLLPPNLAINLEKTTAYAWLQKYYGPTIFRLIWKPLLDGKFGDLADQVNMAWFWARIYKRTPTLGYLEGGYQTLADRLDERIRKMGGEILYGATIQKLMMDGRGWKIDGDDKNSKFEAVISTVPSPLFVKLFPNLPKSYQQQITATPHLHALNLVLVTKEPVLKDTYWLNINDPGYPFLALVQHTNFADSKHYGDNHILYVGNYLPPGHQFLTLTKEKLLQLFLRHLEKINPEIRNRPKGPRFEIRNSFLFMGPFAQPVMTINYSKRKPTFETPLASVYLANMDMVYPWDRGTNYAIELGKAVAERIQKP